MDAWEILISNSTISPDHDAWEHLNAQGGGENIYCILQDGLDMTLELVCFEIEIEQDYFELEMENILEIFIEPKNFEVEVC
jgi:hypothetical protein